MTTLDLAALEFVQALMGDYERVCAELRARDRAAAAPAKRTTTRLTRARRSAGQMAAWTPARKAKQKALMTEVWQRRLEAATSPTSYYRNGELTS